MISAELIKLNLKLLLLYVSGGMVETSDFNRSYDSLAEQYDQTWYTYLSQTTLDILQNIKDLNPKIILDLGCGSGSSTIKIKEMFPQSYITALDFSKPMLNLARKKLGSEKTLYFRESIERGVRKFPNLQFDLITCCWSLGYARDRRVYKELMRILKDNGHLLIITNKQDTLKNVRMTMHHTMLTHYKSLQRVPSHKFPKSQEYLLSRLGKGFELVKSGEGEIAIDITNKTSVLDWILNTGILAGYEYMLDLRHNEAQRKTFETYIKTNFKEVIHNYMWLLVRKIKV